MVSPLLGFAILYEWLPIKEVVPTVAVPEGGISIDDTLYDIADEGIHCP
jgi:hypothetical protein